MCVHIDLKSHHQGLENLVSRSIPKELLAFREVASKNKNWGLQAHMIVDQIMYMSWVDTNSVQLTWRDLSS